jgi:sRNA-binding regulator protein Hfq
MTTGKEATQRQPQGAGNFNAKKQPFVAKGHDAQLMDAQNNVTPTTISLISGGSYEGIIVKRDKYTITLRHAEGLGLEAGQDEIFYKHAIEGVRIRRETLQ